MKNEEALAVLELELAKLRDESYSALVTRISRDSLAYEVTAPSGAKYQVEIEVVWDIQPGSNVRVMGMVDDGEWRAFVPLTRDFIKTPDDSFIGE